MLTSGVQYAANESVALTVERQKESQNDQFGRQ